MGELYNIGCHIQLNTTLINITAVKTCNEQKIRTCILGQRHLSITKDKPLWGTSPICQCHKVELICKY